MKIVVGCFLAGLCLAVVMGACSAPAVTPVTGGGRAAILQYAEPKTDNLLAGLAEGDYGQFSRDMSPEMLKAMTEQQMTSLRDMLQSKIGAYVSRTVSSVEQSGRFTAIIYDAQYENEEHVTMRVVFDENQAISGLWFDSPKLRK